MMKRNMKGTEMFTVITFQAPKELALKLRIRAAELNISRSQALRQAAENWLGGFDCPTCNSPTFPRDGVRYCARCNVAVELDATR